MSYNQKPKMILFDVGGTLFNDGKCSPVDGFEKLRLAAKNPDVTDGAALAALWDEYMSEVSGLKSKSGITLDAPLSAVIKYAAMHTGLHFDISIAEQEELFDRYNSTRNVIDGVPELLAELEALGIRAAVISNNMMSGDSLAMAIKHWIPSAKFEFCLTSADLLFTKPCKNIFTAAANFAHLDPADCWYCGDGRIPDVDGARNGGMTPVLLDEKSAVPFEMRADGGQGEYLAVNNWNVLKEHLRTL